MNLSKPQKLARNGKLSAALDVLSRGAGVADPRPELLRARLLASAGRPEEGILEFQKLVESRPQFAPGHLFYGIMLWDSGDIPRAADQFDDVLRLQPSNDLARSYKALCSQAQGNAAAAVQVWKAHGFSDNTDYRIRVIEYVEKAWLMDQAYLGVKDAAEPVTFRRASERKALAKFYKRDFPVFLEYVPPPPIEKELSAFLGATAYEMIQNYPAAMRYLEPLLPRREEWPDALVALYGRLLCRAGRFNEAATELAKVLIIGPEDFGVNYYLGVISLAFGMEPEARNFFMRALTSYMVDTLEFQWWQIEQALLSQSLPAAP